MKVPRWAAGLQAGGHYTYSITERLTSEAEQFSRVRNSPRKPRKPYRLLSYSTGTAKTSRGFENSKPLGSTPETPTSTPIDLPAHQRNPWKHAPSRARYSITLLAAQVSRPEVTGGTRFYSSPVLLSPAEATA